MIIGSAVHKGIEERLKFERNPYTVADEYIKENLEVGGYNAYASKEYADKYALSRRCLDNFETAFYPALRDQLTDPEHQVELRLETPFRKGVLVGVIDVAMPGIFADWKHLWVETPIITLSGWKTMSSLNIGDWVFDADGNKCRVINKSGIKNDEKCYKIIFSDGSDVVCSDSHRWVVNTGYGGRYKEQTLTTIEMASRLENPVTKSRDLRIKVAKPLNLWKREDQLIDPYILGAWLGDGLSKQGVICGIDYEIFATFESLGATCKYKKTEKKSGNFLTYCRIEGLTSKLRYEQLLNNKHIPEKYMFGSYEQRLELLRGLMDTDGYYNKMRNQAVFTSSKKEFAKQVQDLILSLGVRVRTFKVNKTGFGKKAIAYDVAFTPVEFNPFKMTRKAELVRLSPTRRSKTRLVMSITEVPSVPVQCIMVDSPTHTFLCGDQMIPTHNTGARVPSDFSLMMDPQSGFYWYLAQQTGMEPVKEFVYVYLNGKNMAYQTSKTGKTITPNKTNPQIRYSFPVYPTEESVNSLLNNFIIPLAKAYEDGVVYKNPSDFNCGGCLYRSTCLVTDLPSKEDYD